MTVKELQEKLAQFPEDARLVLYSENGFGFNDVQSVRKRYAAIGEKVDWYKGQHKLAHGAAGAEPVVVFSISK